MRGRNTLLLLLVVLFFSTGCTYMRHRGLDAADVFSVDIGLGWGLGVNVMLTKYVAFNAGVAHAAKCGTIGRYAGYWHERIMGWPASWALLFTGEGWCGCFYGLIVNIWARDPGPKKTSKSFELRYFICGLTEELGEESPYRVSPWEFGVSVHPVVFGTRLAFNPVEFADFLAGWLTIDFMDDDKIEEPEEPPVEEPTDFVPGEEPED